MSESKPSDDQQRFDDTKVYASPEVTVGDRIYRSFIGSYDGTSSEASTLVGKGWIIEFAQFPTYQGGGREAAVYTLFKANPKPNKP